LLSLAWTPDAEQSLVASLVSALMRRGPHRYELIRLTKGTAGDLSLGAEDWRAPVLLAVAHALEAAAESARFRYLLTLRSSREAWALVPLAAWLLQERPASVGLSFELPNPGDTPDSELVRLSGLLQLPVAVRRLALFSNALNSRVGRPLCWFSHRVPTDLSSPAVDHQVCSPTFGPDCAECVVRPGCTGISADYARRVGFEELRSLRASGEGEVSWEDQARWLLVDRPFRSLRFEDLVPTELPDIRCIRPWTRFELHEGGSYGPCSQNFMEVTAPIFPDRPNLHALWNGDLFRAFRKSLSGPGHPSTCRRACPALACEADHLKRWWLHGGSAAMVENELRTAHSILGGEPEMQAIPVSFNIATTSFCNYDCLMCNCGRTGTLEDEKTESFYHQLARWEDRLVIIEANGGEPLASSHYRACVEKMAHASGPSTLQITTNGSLMTPRWLHGLPRLPYAKICISINAASADTYLAVNRGVSWDTIRRNIEALLQLRREGYYTGLVTYSMVVLRRNLHEVRAFAEMAIRDGTEVRYMLPMRELSGQTVMTSHDTMAELKRALEDVIVRLREQGMSFSALDAEGRLAVLRNRLDAGLYEAL
jgi:wyosine [tRNA(Phe)-imidazoG37] synthetase (radical SAM superfamily)